MQWRGADRDLDSFGKPDGWIRDDLFSVTSQQKKRAVPLDSATKMDFVTGDGRVPQVLGVEEMLIQANPAFYAFGSFVARLNFLTPTHLLRN